MIDDLLDRVSDVAQEGSKNRRRQRQPSVSIVVGNVGDNSTVIIGDTGHRRRKEDREDEEDEDSDHGRRASDRELRREVRDLRSEVRSLKRLVKELRESGIQYKVERTRCSPRGVAARPEKRVSNHATHQPKETVIHVTHPRPTFRSPCAAQTRATQRLSRYLPRHPAESRNPIPSVLSQTVPRDR